jgi:hypothetical protein
VAQEFRMILVAKSEKATCAETWHREHRIVRALSRTDNHCTPSPTTYAYLWREGSHRFTSLKQILW